MARAWRCVVAVILGAASGSAAADPNPPGEDVVALRRYDEALADWMSRRFMTRGEAAQGVVDGVLKHGVSKFRRECLHAEFGGESEDLWRFSLRFDQGRCGGAGASNLLDHFAVVKYSDVVLWSDWDGDYVSLVLYASYMRDVAPLSGPAVERRLRSAQEERIPSR